jgi:DNA mismatch repair protein MutS2
LRQTEGELRAEEARIWRMLTLQILDNAPQLQASAFAVGQLDLVVARMWLGQRRLQKARIPIVKDEGIIAVQQAHHPVLLLREMNNVVGSNVKLGEDGNQGLVLTGPNAGGKTVILKLLGLFALMARAGIPVPANRNHHDDDSGGGGGGGGGPIVPPPPPRVDFFNPVLADIGDLQSVGGDLSTFSGHMLVCRQVLQNAKRNALVLMDELGSGTDPAQGVAIAQSLLEAVVETGARVAITTHYMQLKQLAASDDRFAVGGMQFVQGRPTYRLLPGTVGESFALSIAERLGLPKSVISRANELLDSETRQMGDLIRELEEQKSLVDEQVLELQEKQREMKQLEFQLQEQRAKLEREQLTVRREEARKFARQLEEKEQLMQDILKNLQSDPSRRLIAKSWEDIKLVKRSVLNEAEQVPSVVARQQKAAYAVEQASAALVPLSETDATPNVGDVLVVCKQGPLFAREAIVEQMLGRNRVEVRVNGMNVAMKLSEVALLPTGSNRNKVVEAAAFVPTRRVGSNNNLIRGNAISKAASDAIAREGSQPQRTSKWDDESLSSNEESNARRGSNVEMRTMSNTVDVRGCNLMEAQAKIKDKFSACLLSGRGRFVYVLHGHGSQGILKSKIRGWLQSEKQLVKSFQPASAADGGDAFTRVELK